MFKGAEAAKLGRSNEQAVLCCDVVQPIAQWVTGMRAATPEEDSMGIDVVVSTDCGDVPLQVKSGGRRARAFQKEHPDIPVVVVYPGDSESRIRSRVRSAVHRHLQNDGRWSKRPVTR